MGIFSTNHTKDAIIQIKNELSKFVRIFSFFVHLLFIGFYTYTLISSLDNIVLTIFNSIFLLISIVTLIISCVITFDNKKTKKKVNKSIRYFKYVVRFLSIVYNFVISLNVIHVILTVGTLIILILQLFFEFIIHVLSKYIDSVQEAVKKDYEDSNFIGKGILNKVGIGKVVNKEEPQEIEVVEKENTTKGGVFKIFKKKK